MMRFEARELELCGEPVSPDDLKIGEICFAVLFLDENGLVPILDPNVFVGRDLKPGDERRFYFQDYTSYENGIRLETATGDDESRFATNQKYMFAYEWALDVLMVCALRRQKILGRA
jgi:hypothetical protein